MLNFKILTLFPELFPGPLAASITGTALEKKIWSLEAINIRDYAKDERGTVDDAPYGGGAGMVLKADVIANAIEGVRHKAQGVSQYSSDNAQNTGRSLVENKPLDNSDHASNPYALRLAPYASKIIYLSPRGKVFNQKIARELAEEREIIILCGRYEGVDQRVLDEFQIEEISIGDYVLSGGEIAAFVFIDAILRNVENVLGAEGSLSEESFGSKNNNEFENLLEYPHFTRPAVWRGRNVPEVLTSGNHKKISEWRKERAKELTKKIRPDLHCKT
jgi:tRNA (guanine37-N1)-methyltransferase